MKRRNSLTCAAAVALVATISPPGLAEESLKPGAESVVKEFNETAETFANPGQGWMTMQRMPYGDDRFPYSVAYIRLNWDELEPAERLYDWRLIDESLLAWGNCRCPRGGASADLPTMTRVQSYWTAIGSADSLWTADARPDP